MKNSNNYSATPVPKPDIKPVGTGSRAVSSVCSMCGNRHEEHITKCLNCGWKGLFIHRLKKK